MDFGLEVELLRLQNVFDFGAFVLKHIRDEIELFFVALSPVIKPVILFSSKFF